ncbi:flagellar basal body-associated protein FliL [Pseudorhodobacter sp.]|uniref:flagellar basal body-associated FliL family protein n=1 Tax=Pseudorhodobacter sp. TaxID=1934400 RepID=UPI00264707BA|nr:flagellar basal body-associated FliL family protein [Pseudorhodobacter sp.]MDN5786672.1 flagellar basal body-associated FliL family protein [Pseudorhodobacter sp.]
MAEVMDPKNDAAPRKKSKLPLLLGLVGAVLVGVGGFYATWSGLLLGGGHEATASPRPDPLPEIAFVPVEPIIISLGPGSSAKHLRFTAQLEVGKANTTDVTLLLPRILDVLNGYLRAIDVAELEDPSALVRLRAHMLRRIQIVTGEGRVRDLLITEFVLN